MHRLMHGVHLQDRSPSPRAELQSQGGEGGRGVGAGSSPDGSVGWSWKGSTLRSSVSVSLCGNAYLTWQVLPSLT